MNITVEDSQNDLSINTNQVKLIVTEVLSEESCQCDEVIVNFIDMAQMCSLHQEFFNDPSPTDCISFPLDDEEGEPYRVLGEIFVSPKAAIDYVKEHGGVSYRETTLYIIHGLLHLLGYDDIDDSDREEMRAAEKRHLINLENKEISLESRGIT